MDAEELSIGAVERETGLTKDTLRIWERRYGFPVPVRDPKGNRVYTLEQVQRLRDIKRMVDNGFRPSKIIGSQQSVAATIAQQRSRVRPIQENRSVPKLLELIKRGAPRELKSAMSKELAALGLRGFVLQVVRPLTIEVGERWAEGELDIHHEHLYCEQLRALLHTAMSSLHADANAVRIVLTTLPEEAHALGLLMAQCMLALESVETISLGVQTPIEDIAQAVHENQADAAALSFSVTYNAARMSRSVSALRQRMPDGAQLWLGGAGAARFGAGLRVADAALPDAVATPAGVLVLTSLEQIAPAVAALRAHIAQRLPVRAHA
jgi:MerR family transcriptional regulator, light-induced transcriptional regulator